MSKILVPVVKTKCSGCKACLVACPNSAITMFIDEEGFSYPQRDDSKCVKCKLCEKVCSACTPYEPRRPKFSYAAKARDTLLRVCSSSGGVFSVLARQCLLEGGVVFGAGFEKETWRVVHKMATSQTELEELRGSKYVQSDVDIQSIRDVISSGRKVIFVGTPCQAAAVRRVCGNPENLIIVDLVCHGVPSPQAWRRYLEQRKSENGPIKCIQMRNKQIGWQVFSQRIEFLSGAVYCASLNEDSFLRGFLRDIYLRPSCYECSWRGHRSESDLTLGDYWGVAQFHPSFIDNEGVSALFVNTEKGQIALKMAEKALYLESTRYECVANENPALMKSPSRPPERDVFFNLLKTVSFDYAVNQMLNQKLKENPKRIGILTFHSQLNYGGVLQCSALRTAILELAKQGTEVFVIDRWMSSQNELLHRGFSQDEPISFEIGRGTLSSDDINARYHGRIRRTEEFIRNNLNLTKVHFLNWNELSNDDINRLSLDLIIVGSDQVWHFGDWGNPLPYLLEGCPDDIPAVSYAASFGCLNLNEWEQRFRKKLKRFSALSCRELSGVNLCLQIGYTAEHVIDPVGLVDFDNWLKSIDITVQEKDNREGLLYYCMDDSVTERLPDLASFAKNHGCTVTILVNRIEKSWQTSGVQLPSGVEIDFAAGPVEFIHAICRTKWLITDSFHAFMLSLIRRVDVRVLRPTGVARIAMFSRIEELANCLDESVLVDSFHEALESLREDGRSRCIDVQFLKSLREQSQEYLARVLAGKSFSPSVYKSQKVQISVLLVVNKSDDMIAECALSVLRQSAVDVELILVNSCSDDEVSDMLRNLSQGDLRINLIEYKGHTQAEAYNKGVSVAKGEYLLFMDCEERLSSFDILEKAYRLADAGKLEVLLGGASNLGLRVDGNLNVSSSENIFLVKDLDVSGCLFSRQFWNKYDLNFFYCDRVHDAVVQELALAYAKRIDSLDYRILIRKEKINWLSKNDIMMPVHEFVKREEWLFLEWQRRGLMDKFENAVWASFVVRCGRRLYAARDYDEFDELLSYLSTNSRLKIKKALFMSGDKLTDKEYIFNKDYLLQAIATVASVELKTRFFISSFTQRIQNEIKVSALAFMKEQEDLRNKLSEAWCKIRDGYVTRKAIWIERCDYLKRLEKCNGELAEGDRKRKAIWAERCDYLNRLKERNEQLAEGDRKRKAIWAERCDYLKRLKERNEQLADAQKKIVLYKTQMQDAQSLLDMVRTITEVELKNNLNKKR